MHADAQPQRLRDSFATLLFRDELASRADDVTRALGGEDALLGAWRDALAMAVFDVAKAHLQTLKVSPAGAFVLSRDVDELRKAVADLGSDAADAEFARLREGLAVFKLDPDSLKYLVIQPNGPLSGQTKDDIAAVLLRRTDAWNYRGRKANWVDDVLDSL